MKYPKQLHLPGAVFGCLLMLLFAACSQKDKEMKDASPAADVETMTEYLVSQGFDGQQIVFEKDRVIIEQDIIMTMPELEKRVADWQEEKAGGVQTEQRRHTSLISNSYNSNVRIYIDPGVPTAWRTAVQGAVNNWNSISGTRLGMSITTSQSNAHCVVFMGYQNANWVARAYLPSGGLPGVSVEINGYYNSLSASYKLFTITHEFGHTVGFHHTNQTSGIHIPGTPTSDPNSVMNSFILPWAGFTSGDVLATQIIYPL
ncbi:dual-action HEIGH metallo-peptidase [Chitinophaga japonensis]|uniref:Dual-action HEIGH metallo-peptidase n=2 Tax=Chitinophaga japonensis TaxID=104662 RepID=A0A562T4Y4_CHIJA|nr:dual-action HEIGH metallo-peptidase [Chitinophaga japonensis]